MKPTLALSLLLLVGCNQTGTSHSCRGELQRGVIVKLSDAQTGLPIHGAKLELYNIDFSEELLQTQREPDAIYEGAIDHADGFNLMITADGYKPQEREGILVKWDGCTLLTQKLDIELEPDPTTQNHDVVLIFRKTTDAPTEPDWIAVPVDGTK